MRSTGNAVYETAYHLVWSTKYRRRVLGDQSAVLLRTVVGEVCMERGWQLHALEVMSDHVHVFVGLPPAISPSMAAHHLKGRSSRVLRKEIPALRRQPHRHHLWNPSYYVGTAGGVTASAIERYIANQKVAS